MAFMKKPLILVLLLSAGLFGYLGPKAWKAVFKTEIKEKKVVVVEQKPFVVIIPSYNNGQWCERNLRSVFEQKYDNYRIIYIDDCSKDETAEKVEKFIKQSNQKSRVTLIKNRENRGAMANYYFAIKQCDDHEIVIALDGDDWLAHEGVLERLNEAYADPDVWMTYGSFIEYPSYHRSGWAKLLPSKVIKNNSFRKYRWSSSHLRSFYAGLFKSIKLQDLLFQGRFYDAASDLAYMFPMLEMAGRHSHFIKDILYVYNHATALNDDKLRWERQQMLDKYIRSLSSYALKRSISSEQVEKETADVVVFSYNRPMQLYAFLESMQRYMTNVGECLVVYRASGPEYVQGYGEVQKAFPKVKFTLQSEENPKENFKPLVMEAVYKTPSAYVIFAVDDILLKDEVDLSQCVTAMEETGAYGFFLRLGKHTDHSYMLNKVQGVPPSIEVGQGIFAWQFEAGKIDWKYPNCLDLTVYKKEEIRPRLERIKFSNPNDFECHWMQKVDFKKIGLYFERSKMVNIPLNLVNISGNRHMHSYSTEELLEKFQAGLKIDIRPFYQMENRSTHIDNNVEFINI